MSSQNEQLVQMAISEAKVGHREKARELLEYVVKQEPGNARAWYLLSQVVEKPVEAVECLKKVLEIDPDNLQAMERLEHLQTEQKAPKSKKVLLGPLGWILLAIVACMGVSMCLLGGIAISGSMTIPAAKNAPVEIRATVDLAIEETMILIPSVTLAPTQTETAIPSETATNTATKIPTITPITAMPGTQAVNQPAVLGGMMGCIPAQTPQRGLVSKVVDGDTIDVVIGNSTYAVRYIGMDTLEMGSGGTLAIQAKAKNEALVFGKTVNLYRDHSETDRYDRLLRYVTVGDVFVNLDLVKSGLAEAKSYPPDTACDLNYQIAEQEAQLAGLGMWGAALVPSLTPMVIVNPPSRSGGANCDPAYPTVCIPPPPPDLDCKDVTFRNFKVLPPDPHNFDGNGDGVGCEG